MQLIDTLKVPISAYMWFPSLPNHGYPEGRQRELQRILDTNISDDASPHPELSVMYRNYRTGSIHRMDSVLITFSIYNKINQKISQCELKAWQTRLQNQDKEGDHLSDSQTKQDHRIYFWTQIPK